MNETAERMMFESHDYIGEHINGEALVINDRALVELEHWSDSQLGGFIKFRLLLMRLERGADPGVDQIESTTEPAPNIDNAVASTGTA